MRSFIPPEDLADFDVRVQPWFDSFDSFAVSSRLDEGWFVTTGLLTVK